MLEPPALANDRIVAAVRAHYDVPVAALTFLPIGHDSAAWAYRVEATDGAAYFLKVRARIANVVSLVVPRHVQGRGVIEAVAPLPTLGRALWVELDGFALILYPFVDGTTGMAGGMAERHWTVFGAALGRLHATPLAPELDRHVRRESFVPAWGEVARRLDAHIAARAFADPVACELADFWRTRREEIRALVERAEALGERLRAAAPPPVLCHADAHTANVMIDSADRLRIVDWDETVLAPRERDLMFVVGGIRSDLVGPRAEARFFQGYGPTTVDPLALAYYRHAWAVNDVGSFGEQALLLPGQGVRNRRAAVRGFLSLFEPGAIVALARASDDSGN